MVLLFFELRKGFGEYFGWLFLIKELSWGRNYFKAPFLS